MGKSIAVARRTVYSVPYLNKFDLMGLDPSQAWDAAGFRGFPEIALRLPRVLLE